MKKKVTQILSIALCMVLLSGSTVTANAAKKSSNTGAYQAVFDAEYYYNSNPDLQAAFGYDAQKLLNHFVFKTLRLPIGKGHSRSSDALEPNYCRRTLDHTGYCAEAFEVFRIRRNLLA